MFNTQTDIIEYLKFLKHTAYSSEKYRTVLITTTNLLYNDLKLIGTIGNDNK